MSGFIGEPRLSDIRRIEKRLDRLERATLLIAARCWSLLGTDDVRHVQAIIEGEADGDE